MKTRPWNLLSFINKSGRLVPEQIEEDRAAIRTLYQNRGFADAEVTDVQTQPLEKGSRVGHYRFARASNTASTPLSLRA